MKKIALILLLIVGVASCRDNVVIDEPPVNPYGAVFENNTKGQVYIQSSQLVMGMPEVLPGEISAPMYGSTPDVSITYFGEGTHFKKVKKDIVLVKDKISRIVLDYPIAQ